MRVLLIGQESYWFDEIWAVKQVRASAGDLLADLAREDVHPPLYPLVLWGWVRLLGEAEWATRLLSAIFSTGAVGMLYLIGRDLYDRHTGLLAAGILGLNAYAVAFGQETRAYSMMLFLGLLATWLLIRWCAEPKSRRAMGLYIAAGIPLAYVHVYGSFLLLAHGLYALAYVPALRTRMIVAGLAVGAAFAPWVPVMLRQVGRVQEGFWIAPLDFVDPLKWLWHWSGYSIPGTIVFVALVIRGIRERAAPRALVLLWLTVPIAVPVALSLLGEPIFHHKYPIVIVAALCLLAARGILTIEPQRLRMGALAGFALLLIVVLPTRLYFKVHKEQYRELAALAVSEADAGVVVFGDESARPYLTFYLHDERVTWLSADDDVTALETAARAAQGKLVYVLVHPKTSDREAALAKRWERTDEVVLREARALRYRLR